MPVFQKIILRIIDILKIVENRSAQIILNENVVK